jgi:uncharacterized membrane protein YtjA (UPF0391 family)
MRTYGLGWLVVLFAILAIIFGFWGFAAVAVWEGIRVLFWVFLALFILSLLGGMFRPTQPPLP